MRPGPLPEPAATDPTTIAGPRRWTAVPPASTGPHSSPPCRAYRVPVVLRHVDDLTYPELASALGRPEGTLKAQVHRGLAMLRTAMAGTDLEELTA